MHHAPEPRTPSPGRRRRLVAPRALSIAALSFALMVPLVPAGAQEPAPSPAATASATAEPSSTTGPTTPADGAGVAPAPAAPSTAPSPTPSPSRSTAAPSPTASATASTRPAPTLEEEIGELGASMGQGLKRLRESGDVQAPTDREQTLNALVKDIGVDAASAQVAAEPPANAAAASTWRPPGIQGIDVSSHQFEVDWRTAYNQGARFAYVKATEGTGYKNPYFGQQYGGSAGVGMVRGAYHFALPGTTSGAAQANYFVDNGGGWSADGRTLPPLLDVEYNPYTSLGNDCYNMSAAQMVSWIRDFSNTVRARTGRVPMIYTTTDWWNRCTGNSRAFNDHPLHIAAYNQSGPGAMPSSWSFYSVWQYSASGPFVGDSNVWNGSAQQLSAFVRNSGSGNEQQAQPGVNELHYRGATPASSAMGIASDTVLSCDWNGDGISTPATFSGGIWTIRNSMSTSDPGTRFTFGNGTDQPICGDWNGDGVETIGVYRSGVAYVRNANAAGPANGTIVYGARGDVAIVGDWDRDGYDTLGVARPNGAAKQFILTNSNIRATVARTFLFGNASDVPVSGDWTNSGYSTVGVKRGAQWFLAHSNVRVAADSVFAFGNRGDRAITGRWAAGRGTSVGVVRPR